MSSLIELARKLRPYIEKAAIALDDTDALEATQLFPIWHADATYEKDARVRYDTILYKCLQNHMAQEAWTPIAAPSLWTKVLIPSPDVIPEWEQPDSTNPYQMGDRVRYDGKIWESTINNNVWVPGTGTLWKEINI